MPQTRDELKARRTKPKTVPIPEYGDYSIRRLTLADTKLWYKTSKADPSNSMSQLLCLALTDEEGKRLYKDNELEAVSTDLEYPIIDALYNEIMDHSKLRKEEKPVKLADDLKN